ncbi:HP1 family phage holin [Cronobacter malonaticus]|uniref:HP1 family phage holin n=1 Tax=Cronobacter malonaticus TaxID=413503 RepID=UPI002895E4FA|nr:HP1 family phage holin [Cronobacter malonaticus]MDT3560225.1 HP1 family phage holin [Cronobacter malonaticus]
MGLTMDKISTFLAYWLSALLAFFGAMTPQDVAAYFGMFGVAVTVAVNWYYRRKEMLFRTARKEEVIRELSR